MLPEEWEPLYREILEDMGYSREEDERAARVLAPLLPGSDAEAMLRAFFEGRPVTVVGAGPGLEEELRGGMPEGAVVAAGSAARWLMEAGVVPDMLVTDLDGDLGAQREACRRGAIPVVHAHGDNIPLLEAHARGLGPRAVGSCQCPPLGGLVNYGGFTDGDRAVCMACHFRARVRLLGFDFTDPREDGAEERRVKLRKLRWAERIISLCPRDCFVSPRRT